jgi:hypothetical protein
MDSLDSHPLVVLDMDSTEIPVYGEQEHGAAGGKTSEPVAVRGDAGPDRATAGTDGIDKAFSSKGREETS